MLHPYSIHTLSILYPYKVTRPKITIQVIELILL